ncbi:type VI secretion system-associated protein TagO [Hoeflea sp. TYP-13]|uniref:type VI secretion system-associated protein TagO n=1 Tax=Hoeflea sp. TYP-13 TaxID=3230023 RepID=UPI0034C63182
MLATSIRGLEVMRVAVSACILLFALSDFAVSQSQMEMAAKRCAKLDDAGSRLTCYDGLFKSKSSKAPLANKTETTSVQAVAEPPIGWKLSKQRSSMDDSIGVFLDLYSITSIPKKFGSGQQYARLTIRCHENTTALMIGLGDHFLADIGDYGIVRYRIDKQPAKANEFAESTDNTFLGLWKGRRAIPFIKTLFNANRFTVRIVPFNESSLETSFDIRGLDEAIKPLRKACGW